MAAGGISGGWIPGQVSVHWVNIIIAMSTAAGVTGGEYKLKLTGTDNYYLCTAAIKKRAALSGSPS